MKNSYLLLCIAICLFLTQCNPDKRINAITSELTSNEFTIISLEKTILSFSKKYIPILQAAKKPKVYISKTKNNSILHLDTISLQSMLIQTCIDNNIPVYMLQKPKGKSGFIVKSSMKQKIIVDRIVHVIQVTIRNLKTGKIIFNKLKNFSFSNKR